jgi:drug/metabolite transporter (DMT)-like permease
MNSVRQQRLCVLFAFLGYSIFGFSFLFSKRALGVATPYVLLTVRFGVAFLLLCAMRLTKRFAVNFNLRGKRVGLLMLLGIVQPVLYFLCENYGVALSPTSFVGIMLSMVPIVSSLLGFLFLKERVSAFQIALAGVSVLGVTLTTIGQRGGGVPFLGFLLLAGAVVTASVFNVLSRKISGEFTAFERTYFMFGLGFFAFLAIALLSGGATTPSLWLVPFASVQFWVSIVFLSGLSSVGAFWMINHAVTHLQTAKTAIFANITTVISILAGVLILGERFGPWETAGSALIVLSVYGMNRSAAKKAAPIVAAQP